MSFVKKQIDPAPKRETVVVRKLHGEDIAVGDYVALSQVTWQIPSFCWCPADTTMLPPEQPVRITFLTRDEPMPQRVVSVCLPYVLCRLPDGKHTVQDIRQVQLVRLDARFAAAAQRAWESDQKSDDAKKSGKKKKRKQRRKKK